jgi:hypothetical protein
VTDVSGTYKEKIIDAVIQKEWNIIFHLSTKWVGNCEAKIDKITLCFKKPDDHQCTNLANATIVSKPGACEATIMFNQTSRNIGLKYYVRFPPIDPSDFKEENGDEVNSQTFLLTQGKWCTVQYSLVLKLLSALTFISKDPFKFYWAH